MNDLQEVSQFENILEKFFLERDLSASSKISYKINIRQFIHWLNETDRTAKFLSGKIDKTDILHYRNDLRKTEHSARTINAYIACLRQFFAFLESYRFYSVNPAANIKGDSIQSGHAKDDLSLKQVKEILASIDQNETAGKRDYAINVLKYLTALRDVEISRANIEDIRVNSGEYVLHIHGKGRTETDRSVEFIILKEPAYKAVLEYLRSGGRTLDSKGPLFISESKRNRKKRISVKTVQRAVIEPIRKLGYKTHRITSHSTRHTAISLAYEAGASQEELMEFARHKDPKTTRIYTHKKNRFQSNAETKLTDFFLKTDSTD